MKMITMKGDMIIEDLVKRYPELAGLRSAINDAASAISGCYSRGGKVLCCGNGGSSSQADHLVAELMKSFEIKRPLDESLRRRLGKISGERGKYLAEKLEHSLPAINLSAHCGLISAISNDTDPSLIFAQQILGYGNEKDVLIAISTSGNSQNVIDACITARALNITVIGTTGKSGGKLKEYCDILLNVPSTRTAIIQEFQLPLLHAICGIIETGFYGK